MKILRTLAYTALLIICQFTVFIRTQVPDSPVKDKSTDSEEVSLNKPKKDEKFDKENFEEVIKSIDKIVVERNGESKTVKIDNLADEIDLEALQANIAKILKKGQTHSKDGQLEAIISDPNSALNLEELLKLNRV